MECPQFCIFCHAVYITIIDGNKYFHYPGRLGRTVLMKYEKKISNVI